MALSSSSYLTGTDEDSDEESAGKGRRLENAKYLYRGIQAAFV